MTTSKQQAKPEAAASADFEGVAAFNGMNFEAYAQAAQAMMRGVAAINEELLSFTGKQFRDGAKVSEALLNAGDFNKALRMQLKSTHAASDMYFREMSRLLDLTAKLCRDCAAPIENRAREMIDEVEIASGK